MIAHEVNFDGIVGPTHNYAGLSYGNLASETHRLSRSYPKQAALQGLAKMKLLHGLALKQGVLPPQERPNFAALRRLGFSGSDAEVLARARQQDPVLLAACCSSSSMWAANAATVSPGADTSDGKVHFTPANLVSFFHRSLETEATARALRTIFSDESAFAHHEALPAALHFSDEGAANHTRLCARYGDAGIEVFTYGRVAFDPRGAVPKKYPARQSREASQAIARMHQLDPTRTFFVAQSPQAIDAGVFHNDVVAVGNRDVLLYHELAFADSQRVLDEIARGFREVCKEKLNRLCVPDARVSLKDAVESYLFNSQLVSPTDEQMILVAPREAQENSRVREYVDELVQSGALTAVHYIDLRQSMQNGGGPACLRLRVVLTEAQLAATHPGVLFDDKLHAQLVAWVERHYRDELDPGDLADPKLLDESRAALDQLTTILKLGPLYDFQR